MAWLIIVAVGLSGTGLAVFLKLRHGDDAPVAYSRLRGLRAESVSPCRPVALRELEVGARVRGVDRDRRGREGDGWE